MHLSDQKWWGQVQPSPSPHLSAISGDESILLEIPAYLRLSEGKQLLSFVSVPIVVASEQILTYCSLGPFFLCFCIQHCCTWVYLHLLQPGALLPCCYCCVSHHIIALHS